MANLEKLSAHLSQLLDNDPAEAVRQARQIDIESKDHLEAKGIRAAALVDGGHASRQTDAIQEGLKLYREIYELHPSTQAAYNLANALVASAGNPQKAPNWLDHQECTREQRAEARQLFWMAAQDAKTPISIQTQAWTNLANQFTNSYRLSEAHDTRLSALAVDPKNGVAAGAAARDLLWLHKQGISSDLTRLEAVMLAKVAMENVDRVRRYAGERAAKEYSTLADTLGEPPPRSLPKTPFVQWAEEERITLGPTVELIDPELEKLDWLMLPGIMEREPNNNAGTPPPIFAMFNTLKADFILARDLIWRARSDDLWPKTGRFSDTLDYAAYGPSGSALILAHRSSLDLLDKVATAANHYFEIGERPDKVYFQRLWRRKTKNSECGALVPKVESAIRNGALALYGLVELADDYGSSDGILRPQKDLRNFGTHRFIVLHDFADPESARQCPEIERRKLDEFKAETLRVLRIARSAIQMLALAITQHERAIRERTPGFVGQISVPDHDWIRGREK